MLKALFLFIVRCISAVRHPIVFSRTHPNKTEAIGLLFLLASAFFQIQSDRYQRLIVGYNIVEIEDEVKFTRDKVLVLIECQAKDNCNEFDHDRIKTENSSFLPLDVPERLSLWQFIRNIAFFVGSCMVLFSKWIDGRPLKAVVVNRDARFSRVYRAIRNRLRR